MIGDIYQEKAVSSYLPPLPVMDLTAMVKKDYSQGNEILTRSWPELNNRSVLDDMDRGGRMANAFVDEEVDDPADAWRWRGTRSMARNKGLAMHAQLTAAFLIPGFSAQNDADEMDRDFGDAMHEIVEWMTLPQNSNYRSSFLALVFGMIESPVTYLGAEWCEVYQEIKEKTEEGLKITEILDEVLSGFKAPVFSADQVLISNAYERDIQKHRFNITRRYIEYSEAEAKYGEHENWQFVSPGIKSIYNDDDGLFYDVKDEDHPHLVEEATYKSRRKDLEVCFINGIYFGDENVEANPIKHRDNRNAPKYNIVPFVYNRIGAHFFFGKSMMNAVGWDNQLYDAMSEMVMNASFLELDAPVAVSGSDKIDTDINFPGGITAFADKDTKVQAIFPPKNFAAAYNAMAATKDSIDDGTLSDTSTGQLPEASQKAYTVAQAQANAKKLLQGTAQTLAESIVAYGPLMSDIAINHLTAPQVDEIVGGGSRLKYRKFLLEDQVVDGKRVSKEIRFEEAFMAKNMTEEEERDANLKLLSEVGYPDNKKHLRVLNPHLFSKQKYLSRIDPEEMFPKNQETMQAVLSSFYQLVQQNPFINLESLTRKLAYAHFKGESEEIMQEQPLRTLPGALPGQVGKEGSDMASQFAQRQAGRVAAAADVV
jgi:hypothetical protein